MSQIKQLSEEIAVTGTIREVAQAYEEISVVRMQKVRDSVLKTRSFLDELNVVYQDVRDSYKTQILSLASKKKNKDRDNKIDDNFSTLPRNGKTIRILLSANNRLYGDIIQRTFNQFMADIKKDDSEILLIGKIAKELFENSGVKKEYKYLEIPDDNVKFEDLKPVITDTLLYQNAVVYYGQFINVVTQKPIALNLSGQAEETISETQTKEDNQKPIVRFIFEPSLEKVLNFFETQIFTALFQQTAHESELARYASRINAMEEALANISSRMKKLDRTKVRLEHAKRNRKQADTIAGINLWS